MLTSQSVAEELAGILLVLALMPAQAFHNLPKNKVMEK